MGVPVASDTRVVAGARREEGKGDGGDGLALGALGVMVDAQVGCEGEGMS